MSTILYLNGNIFTMDTAQPRAQAIAIDGTSGRILAIGTNDEVRRVGGQHRELVDLRGKTVLPGFIDAHIHLLAAAYRFHHIDAGACASEDEVATLVRERAIQTPLGRWVLGGHWDKNLWSGGQFPTKASLDAAAPQHPVALWSKDGHLLWVNSLALQRAGITRETPQPDTGAILRDGAGEPSGILQEEAATSLVYSVIDPPDPEMNRRLLRRIQAQLQRSGITTIHDIEDETSLRLFKELRDEGALGMRVQMILPHRMLSQLQTLVSVPSSGSRKDIDSRRSPTGKVYTPNPNGSSGNALGINNNENDLLRIGGIKIFADGTLGSQTAAMLESFEGDPGNHGILTLAETEMTNIVSAATEMGLIVAIHAIGDRAARVALNAIERTQQRLTDRGLPSHPASDLRYRLEHVQLIALEDLERMRRLGVIASVQPLHAVADRDIAERYWGKRHRRAFAYRTMHDMGIPLALGSDAPVESFDPLRILSAATLRRDPVQPRPSWLPEQSLALADALWGYTLGAAYAGAEEKHKGSLTVGKLGDAVVLREDILNVPLEKMFENEVQATILGGKVVYGKV
jgi:predicted amidohydrolase YtcJ